MPQPFYVRLFAMLLCSAPLVAAEHTLVVTSQVDHPILTVRSPGAEGNKYGFEGGRVVKLGGTYHLFTSEMVGEPHWVRMKLAYWTSEDRLHWKRIHTLYESSGDYTGGDARAALWSPMPVYSEKDGRWNLFYVAYQAAPDTPRAWLTNHEGRIWRAVSRVAGRDGIGGPYDDVGVILERGKDGDRWEGLQGTDSFFPYPTGGTWHALYGSAHTEKLPLSLWQVGLAESADIDGPWVRCTRLNPVAIESRFIENPVVSTLTDGSFIAVYDNHQPNEIGYALSPDGIHWSSGRHLVVQRPGGIWASEVRTPLGLIDEGSGRYTLFYTANQNLPGTHVDANGVTMSPGALGMVEVEVR
jgi:hypothetical protein